MPDTLEFTPGYIMVSYDLDEGIMMIYGLTDPNQLISNPFWILLGSKEGF